jgi:hypothetical protein
VSEILVRQLRSVPAAEILSYFRLISVLTRYVRCSCPLQLPRLIDVFFSSFRRDLGDDLMDIYHSFCRAIADISNSVAYSGSTVQGSAVPNPELTGKMFECLSYIFK